MRCGALSPTGLGGCIRGPVKSEVQAIVVQGIHVSMWLTESHRFPRAIPARACLKPCKCPSH
eukprot:4600796-Pyramimonas_sp.AAC.1